MAEPQDRRARLLAALYARFGEAADWTPAAGGSASPVTVRRRGDDGLVQMGPTEVVAPTHLLRVRVADVAAPARRDSVAIGAETFRVMGKPRLVHSGLEWLCEIEAV
jgi:hypothetical protein